MKATWYEDTAGAAQHYPTLQGDLEADVCVVGAGLAGLTTALELQRRGRSVVLLEAGQVADGASGRNGGFVTSGYALGSDAIAKRLGLAASQALHRLSVEGVDYVRAQIAALDPSIAMGEGVILALRYPDADGLKRDAEGQARDYGEELQVWTPEETRAQLKSARYHQALFDPAGLHIYPLRYARALAAEAARLGVEIREKSAALTLSIEGSHKRLRTQSGSLRAATVVLCTSSYGRGLWRPLDRAVLPVATYIAVTEPLGARVEEAIATEAAIADTRRAGDYYRRVAGDRILWGGRITTRRTTPSRLAARMLGDMTAVYPQLAGARMDYAWSGLMGYCLHKMPLIGEIAPGVWTATAFGGHGLNTTALAGCLLARAIAERDESWRRFSPYRASWGGGPFARIGVQASYWWLQAQDRWDERARYGAKR
ncbi:MAG: FAD-binding oxidoreductase [Pseudomonadota bacterium]